MTHLTSTNDHRIRELYETAAELRAGRLRGGTSWHRSVRVRLGTLLLDLGAALVSGARPAQVGRLGR